MKPHHKATRHLWLILAAFGVWFAIFSGLEEIIRGKFWKVTLSIVLGFLAYLVFEHQFKHD